MWVFETMLWNINRREQTTSKGASRIESFENHWLVLHAITSHNTHHVSFLWKSDLNIGRLQRRQIDGGSFETIWFRHYWATKLLLFPIFCLNAVPPVNKIMITRWVNANHDGWSLLYIKPYSQKQKRKKKKKNQ